MDDIENKVNIDDKLFLNTYNADTVSHLIIKDETACANCEDKPRTKFCPARVYEFKDDHIVVGSEGCWNVELVELHVHIVISIGVIPVEVLEYNLGWLNK